MLQKRGDTLFFCNLTVFNQTGAVSFYITLFQVLYQFAWKIIAFKTMNEAFVPRAIFNSACAAMFRLAQVTFKTTGTRFGMFAYSNMLVADSTIHTAWRKHDIFNHFGHFHFQLTPKVRHNTKPEADGGQGGAVTRRRKPPAGPRRSAHGVA
jgi:hypothetical protein